MAKSYGAKVSQRGYDVSGKDFKLLYSSSWPLLTILDSGPFTGKAPGSTIATHNLGYTPMFLVFHDDTNSNGFNNGASGQVHMIDSFHAKYFGMDDNTLVYSSFATGNMNGYYFIFAVDLETDYTAPNVNTGTIDDNADSQDKDYGVKVSKDGFDVSNTDLRNFALHSATRSPMVDSVTTGNLASAGTKAVTHDLGYEPFPFVYAKLTSGSAFSPARYQHLTTATDGSVNATTAGS